MATRTPATGRVAPREPPVGLILVSAKTFAQDRTYATAITSALAALLDQPSQIQDGHVLFLTRH
jgi:hypothetical protein